jgi:Transglutaminase-like superfamily
LFKLLKAEGVNAELVIGLPASPESHIAHAWVEIDGRDVGPPPGRRNHEELARYR